MKTKLFSKKRLGKNAGDFALGIISAILTAIPVKAAERIYFNYGTLGLSISVDSLETFAKEGTINKELEFYLQRVSAEEQAKFREVLLAKGDLNPVEVSRFFNSPMGEAFLQQMGNMINIPGGGNGKYPIRGALVEAAADPEGLSMLNFMRKFPTDIQFNTDNIVEVVKLGELLKTATKVMVEEVAQLSAAETAAAKPINFSQLPDLSKPGEYGYEKQTITLIDESRHRQFLVEIYKPTRWRAGKTPVVVGSHGLSSNPEHFKIQAEHLASYGYLVVLPQHIGSDDKRLKAMLAGYKKEIFDLNEFIDRPLDVSYVLDELERRNETEYGGRLNLESVGVMGHSFGGYTVLALAGAQINFEQLEKDCHRLIWDPNLSLLLQCEALKLPRKTYNFRDERIVAAIAINPVNSSIFGKEGLSKIEIPVALGAGTLDPAAPAVLEQLRSFTWLTTPNKYLVVMEGQAHVNVSELNAGTEALLKSLPNLKLPPAGLPAKYGNHLHLAFFELYVVDNPDFQIYLQSAYGEYLSAQETFKLYVISSASSEGLLQAIRDFRAREGLSNR